MRIFTDQKGRQFLQDADGAIRSMTGVSSPIATYSADFTLQESDSGKFIILDTTSGNINVTIPPDASVAWYLFVQIMFFQRGGNTVTFVAGSGVSVESFNSLLALAGAGAGASLTRIGTDSWTLIGNLA